MSCCLLSFVGVVDNDDDDYDDDNTRANRIGANVSIQPLAGMLMAQGGEGAEWIARLPGRDISNFRKHGVNCSSETLPGSSAKSCNGYDGDKEWWVDGGMIGASLFERECDKAARKIGRLYDDSSTYGLTGTF